LGIRASPVAPSLKFSTRRRRRAKAIGAPNAAAAVDNLRDGAPNFVRVSQTACRKLWRRRGKIAHTAVVAELCSQSELVKGSIAVAHPLFNYN